MSTQFNLHYLSLALLSLPLLPAANSHAAGVTTRASVNSTGAQGNYFSGAPAISADGRYVAFNSRDSNLVPDDTNEVDDIFVHDRLTSITTRVNVNSAGKQTNRGSIFSSISADGRYVAFESSASNLVSGDTNKQNDVFVHDRATGKTTRVSVSSAGEQGNGFSSNNVPCISADGRYVAFNSFADNLVPEDTNGAPDVFVRDRIAGKTTRISVDSAGEQANDYSNYGQSISADGRYVAFISRASNLVPGDNNGQFDAFVHDRTTRITSRVSVDSAGGEGHGYSRDQAINADGRYVAFTSRADNLMPGDTNGDTDVFVHDRLTGKTTRVSVNSAGRQGNLDSFASAISADGRYVTFRSDAQNLVEGDDNRRQDVFVHNRTTSKTSRVSVDSLGLQVNGYSGPSSISADGRYVAFNSAADNLVPEDTNGWNDIFVRDRWLNTSQSADLQLTVTSEPDSVQNGDVGRYLFTITNNGPDNAESVTLTDSVSAGKVWSLTPSQGDCSIAAVSVCRFHKLAAGESATVRTVFKAKGNPLIQNLTVNAEPADSDPDNNRVTVSTPVTP